jgi:RimJ/RimL family protein N-acetyltransferase
VDCLKSKRLLLRPIKLDDAKSIFSYRADPEIGKFQMWRPGTLSDVEEFIRTQIVCEPNLPGTWLQLAICRIDSPEIIGDCGLHFDDREMEQVEIGITLKREHQRFGYATEALKTLFRYLFEDLEKHRIYASVDPGNEASIRLLERMKMRREAHFIETIRIDDLWADDIVYGILKREWRLL